MQDETIHEHQNLVNDHREVKLQLDLGCVAAPDLQGDFDRRRIPAQLGVENLRRDGRSAGISSQHHPCRWYPGSVNRGLRPGTTELELKLGGASGMGRRGVDLRSEDQADRLDVLRTLRNEPS